jgi:hypothetical protein
MRLIAFSGEVGSMRQFCQESDVAERVKQLRSIAKKKPPPKAGVSKRFSGV